MLCRKIRVYKAYLVHTFIYLLLSNFIVIWDINDIWHTQTVNSIRFYLSIVNSLNVFDLSTVNGLIFNLPTMNALRFDLSTTNALKFDLSTMNALRFDLSTVNALRFDLSTVNALRFDLSTVNSPQFYPSTTNSAKFYLSTTNSAKFYLSTTNCSSASLTQYHFREPGLVLTSPWQQTHILHSKSTTNQSINVLLMTTAQSYVYHNSDCCKAIIISKKKPFY